MGTMEKSDVISEGARLVESWLATQADTATAQARLRKAQVEETKVHDALAKWLMPSDAKPGEKIAVWHGDSLIQVEVGGVIGGESGDDVKSSTSTRVTIRTRGKRG